MTWRTFFGVPLLLSMILLSLGAPVEAATAYIRLFGLDSRSHQIVLYANGPLSPSSFHLENPERWVIDLPNARVPGYGQTLPRVPGTPIRGVRIAQFKEGVARIVFDLDRPAEFPLETRKYGRTYRLAFKLTPKFLTPAPKLTPSPKPVVPKPTPSQKPVATSAPKATSNPTSSEPSDTSGLSLRRSRAGWQLTITTQDAVTYTLPQKARDDRLVFDIQGSGTELPKDSLYVDNGLIARVRVVPLNGATNRVIIEFDQPLKTSISQSEDRRTLSLALGSAPPTPAPRKKPNERRVTLDPGHGGADPGTIGAVGTLEKDVTLSMALRLQKLMQDSGMEVQMTRTRDMQILLHPRVDVGDAFDSDVFISIHANHIDDPRIEGIETYYFTPKSLPLAQAVHRRLISILKRPDRGIRRNNFVVVKYNKMPACLVEIGYLSNPREERMLVSPQYQQRAAEAILAGVQDYFKTRSYRQ